MRFSRLIYLSILLTVGLITLSQVYCEDEVNIDLDRNELEQGIPEGEFNSMDDAISKMTGRNEANHDELEQQQQEQKELTPEERQKHLQQKKARDRNCSPDLPHLSVGDVNLTAKNFEKFKQENEVFLLGISDNQCDHCCFTEGMLDAVHSGMQTKLHTYNGKRIKVARLDLFQKMKLSQKERDAFETVPRMLVYKQHQLIILIRLRNGEYYPYESYYIKNLFLHFINRVLYPVLNLKTTEQIDLFLDSAKEYVEHSKFYQNKYEPMGDFYYRMGKRVRVLALFNDKKEYSNEYKLFQKAAQSLVRRDDLRIAVVTNKTLVQHYKQKFGVKWFDEYSLNTIVLEREPGVYHFYDIEKESDDIAYWINKMSLSKLGDELNRETEVISKMLNEAQGIMFINRGNANYGADSKVAKDALQRVAPVYFQNRINFFYAERQEQLEKRTRLGIMWDKVPSFVMVTPKQNYFPIDMEVNLGDASIVDKVLQEHIEDFMKGRLKVPDQTYDQASDSRDYEILDRLSNVRSVNKRSFVNTVTNPDHDILVFVYTSDMQSPNWKKSTQRAYDFDLIALQLRELKIKSVVCAGYDVNVEGMIAEIDDPNVPAIYLYPAKEHSVENRVTYNKKTVDLSSVIQFLQQYAEKKFKVPKDVMDAALKQKKDKNTSTKQVTGKSKDSKKKTEL
ncbi:UNKNOWN [Stylonychia lemnae]|uniref:Thioredoxin domain-containing protein n=1 Tax=Stylonychia lemnae TaxID=5949 RepID=A0A078AZS2_STYLE|nr:UNKNOWN [Stylonychia lemnae]|eukprot:CDW87719.1 UNKNOWN [Stylonychia lemnae]